MMVPADVPKGDIASDDEDTWPLTDAEIQRHIDNAWPTGQTSDAIGTAWDGSRDRP